MIPGFNGLLAACCSNPSIPLSPCYSCLCRGLSQLCPHPSCCLQPGAGRIPASCWCLWCSGAGVCLGLGASPGLFAGGSLPLPCFFCSTRTLAPDLCSVPALGVPSCTLHPWGRGERRVPGPMLALRPPVGADQGPCVAPLGPSQPRDGTWGCGLSRQHPRGVRMRPSGAVPLSGPNPQAPRGSGGQEGRCPRPRHTTPAPGSRTRRVPLAAPPHLGLSVPSFARRPRPRLCLRRKRPRYPQVTAALSCPPLPAAQCPVPGARCPVHGARPGLVGAARTKHSQTGLPPSTRTRPGHSVPRRTPIPRGSGRCRGLQGRGTEPGGHRAAGGLWGRQPM